MKSFAQVVLQLLVIFLAVFSFNASSQVQLTENEITLPTYLMGADVPHAFFKDYKLPAFEVFRGDRSVYPYTIQEKFSSEKKDVKYNAITLENKYIHTQIITDLRGRLQGAYDKRNNFDYIYYNHVIKPQDISIRKAWLSGGLEWNHPGGHGYTQFGKISYVNKEYDDGSKSVIVAEIEPVRNMKWETEVKLSPGRLYLETTCRFYSIAPFPIPFASSLNAALHTSDQLEIIMPKGSHYTGHGKNTMWEWPDFEGMDFSWLKNTQRIFSVFVDGEGLNQDYWGCYSHDENIDAGTVIVADHRFAPGKKYFTWGYHQKGRMWDKFLSDNDGGYIELQQQGFWDNLGYGYAWLDPLEIKEFTVYWYPVKNMGGFVKATKDLALNIKDKGKSNVFLAVQATMAMDNVMINVTSDNERVYQTKVNLELEGPFTHNFKLPENIPFNNLHVEIFDQKNGKLIDYFTRDVKCEQPPLPKKYDKPDVLSMDELYQKGKSYYQDPFSPEAEIYFKEMLKRDSIDSRANKAMGVIWFFRGQDHKARRNFETSLINDHLNDGYEAYYYLGLIEMREGNLNKAKENLGIIGRNSKYRVLSPFYLGNIAVMEKDYNKAVRLFDEALRFGGIHPDIYINKAIALRKLNEVKYASEILNEAFERDPLVFNGITEKWFMAEGNNKEQMKEMMHKLFDREDSIFIGSQLYLETALRYMELYEWEDAHNILKEAIRYFSVSNRKINPMLEYYLAYCFLNMGNKEANHKSLEAARNRSNKFVFPYRQYSLNVLQSALEVNPDDANGWMYFGNLNAYLRQHEKAIDSWKRSVELEQDNTYALHNLASAYWYVNKDMDKSISYLEKALELAPNDGSLIMELDHFYIAGDIRDKRMGLYQSHEKTVREDDDLVLRWVDMLIQEGKFELAVDLMDKTYFYPKEMNHSQAYVHTRFAEAHFGIGEKYLEEGKVQEALHHFMTGSEYPEHLNDIYAPIPVYTRRDFLIGMAYEKMGNDKKAKEQWRKVISGNSREFHESDYYKALALIKIGKGAEGKNLLEAMINHHTGKINEEINDNAKSISYFLLSRIYDYLDKKKEADEYFKKGLSLNNRLVIDSRLEATHIPIIGL